jgi:hypothetical protein
MMAVPISSGDDFASGPPIELFAAPIYADLVGRTFDVSPDGQRFLMVKEHATESTPAPPSTAIVVVLNWAEELKQRVPERTR